jgi:hypothetical protein
MFHGEEGIDEGGVRKEFFQGASTVLFGCAHGQLNLSFTSVMTRQLLDPSYGMFKYLEESRSLWFTIDSPESDEVFELVGVLLGIAIYNSIILDLHFPIVSVHSRIF